MSTKAHRKAGYPSGDGASDLPASYGLTNSQLEAVRRAQVRGLVEMVPAIGADSEYEVPAAEFLFVYHVSTESPLYDQKSGERLDRGKTIKKFNEAAFKLVEDSGGFRGQKVEILHDPTRAQEWEREQLLEEEEEQD